MAMAAAWYLRSCHNGDRQAAIIALCRLVVCTVELEGEGDAAAYGFGGLDEVDGVAVVA
jgi:hypothetical protein